MAVQSTDLIMLQRGSTLHKATVGDLPAGGGASPGLIPLQQEVVTTPVDGVDLDLPAEHSRLRVFVDDLSYSGSSSYLFATISLDGGMTFESTNYGFEGEGFNVEGVGDFGFRGHPTNGVQVTNNALGASITHSVIDIVNAAAGWMMVANTTYLDATNPVLFRTRGWRANSSKADAIRFKDFTNTIAPGSTFTLYGYEETP